ncbi:inactive C-alpha-formylglycine-generating enzyme 2-like isoform X2 [Watersipora subatra]|uniref:inactive C-alpha-formylglycine-generating enzyme 2-like isoform X2 n=1 Tax=Watersipora subatra TaxID=2589382 RepID=UPI00355C19E6
MEGALLMIIMGVPLISSSHNMFEDYWMYQRFEETVVIQGAQFQMGSRDARLIESGEYPPRKVQMTSIEFDKYPVTNALYWHFQQMSKGKSRTTAERIGYSNVFAMTYRKNMTKFMEHAIPGEPWWIPTKEIKWNRPEGAMSSVGDRMHYPVVHISQSDAQTYCEWNGRRLPTEAEWEFAARGGLSNRPYPWGDSLEANRTNLWQGLFPYENEKLDGYESLAPVDAFPAQNKYGIYDLLGNAWEWTSTPASNIQIAPEMKERFKGEQFYILKGASFIDFREDKAHINHAARISNRFQMCERLCNPTEKTEASQS